MVSKICFAKNPFLETCGREERVVGIVAPLLQANAVVLLLVEFVVIQLYQYFVLIHCFLKLVLFYVHMIEVLLLKLSHLLYIFP